MKSAILRVLLLSLAVFAAGASYAASQLAKPQPKVTLKFLALPNRTEHPLKLSGPQLLQWNGAFTDSTGFKVRFTMVGANPAKSNATDSITTYVIPIKMVYGVNNGNTTFDPISDPLSNGSTTIQTVLRSPVFDPGVHYVMGPTDIGTTQYGDAYQRANFWSLVKKHPNYHLLLNAQVLPELEIDVSESQGKIVDNPIGSGKVGEMEINAFNAQLQTVLKQLPQINPGVLPLFITSNIILTDDSTAPTTLVGGFHSATGFQPSGQTYAYSTFISNEASAFSDVAALSHEIGEWIDDPFADNRVNCADEEGHLLEVGDPLVGHLFAEPLGLPSLSRYA